MLEFPPIPNVEDQARGSLRGGDEFPAVDRVHPDFRVEKYLRSGESNVGHFVWGAG